MGAAIRYATLQLLKESSEQRILLLLTDGKPNNLDHYEGRSFIGWHHHVTAALVCNAFAVAEQARLFPPSREITQDFPLPVAA